jgi:hypothetical protein
VDSNFATALYALPRIQGLQFYSHRNYKQVKKMSDARNCKRRAMLLGSQMKKFAKQLVLLF